MKSLDTCTCWESEVLSPGWVPLSTQSTRVELGDRLAECVSGWIVTRQSAVRLTPHRQTTVIHPLWNSWYFTVKSCKMSSFSSYMRSKGILKNWSKMNLAIVEKLMPRCPSMKLNEQYVIVLEKKNQSKNLFKLSYWD